MQIQVPNETTFRVKEGQHRARLTDFNEVDSKDKKGELQKKWRLLFEVYPTDAEEGVTYMAGKNYEKTLAKGSELRQHLEEWQGPNLIRRGRKFDSELLKGKEAIIEIVHVPNPKHTYPFCNITKILPLPETKPKKAEAEPEHEVGL